MQAGFTGKFAVFVQLIHLMWHFITTDVIALQFVLWISLFHICIEEETLKSGRTVNETATTRSQ